MRRYDTIIFDLDGTLLYTLEDLADATNYALRKHDLPERTVDEVRQFVGNGVRNLMKRAVPKGEEDPDFENIFDDFKAFYGEHCNDKTKPYDGIMELLEQLKQQGYAIAIVSNKLDSAVKELNKRYFDGIIDVAIGEKEGVLRKPAPDTVVTALKELGKSKETAIYVGDSDVDIQTALNAGIPCISVLWGFRDRKFLEEHNAQVFAKIPEDIFRYLA